MKKITLAALVLAAFAASAHAQSNVTIYGVVDLGIAKSTGQPLKERENHASRLGFRGVEDLGNGLSAIFNLESEILADTGVQKGALWERQANVGLKGAFGTVIMGRTKNIVDNAQTRVGPFGVDGVVGKLTEDALRAGVSTSRVSNAFTYVSPSYNGLAGSAQYVLAEAKDPATGKNLNNGYDLLATYDNGPISLHAGYERRAQLVATEQDNRHMWVVGGGYQIDALRLTAAYAKGETNAHANPINEGSYKGWLVGANYAIGGGDAKAVIGRKKQSEVIGMADRDTIREYGVGYDYHLSKRTDLYAYAGRQTANALATTESLPNGTSYQIGVSHKF